MLNFMTYPDNIDVHRATEELDEWGMVVLSPVKVSVKCRLTDSVEAIKMSGQKDADYVAKYSICFPSTLEIHPDDKLEINGVLYDIIKMSKSRDLSGNIMTSKVWV